MVQSSPQLVTTVIRRFTPSSKLCWMLPCLSHHTCTGQRRTIISHPAPCASPPVASIPLHTRVFLPSAAHTHRLGTLLASDSRAGDVILLSGGLGAGKTSLVRGFVHEARGDASLDVTSPTYLLVNSYPPVDEEESVPTVLHMDLWRVEDAAKRPIVDFQKAFLEWVTLVEWPDRLGNMIPEERLEVFLEYPQVKEVQDKDDEDDPWGFGSGDPDDMGAARDGRYAFLTPIGERWQHKIEALCEDHIFMDDEGRMIVSER